MNKLTLLLLMSAALVCGQAAPQDDTKSATPAAPEKPAKPKKHKKHKKAKQQAAAPTAAGATQTAAAVPADKAAAPAATPDKESWIQGNIDVGARYVSHVDGSWNTYRSIVNLNDGLRIASADLKMTPKNTFADSILLQLHDIGDPYSSVRLDMQKNGIYRFTSSYSNVAYFNYLPSFADPTLATTNGFALNEEAYDTRVMNSDSELLFNPGGAIQPYLAYSRNSDNGHGISSLVLGTNNYPVVNNVNWRQDNYRIGARFNWRAFHATIEQGALSFKDDEAVNSNGAGAGTQSSLYIGEQLQLANGWQTYYVRGSGAFTKGSLAYSPVRWLDLYGHIYYTDPSLSSSFGQFAQGTLATIDPNLAFIFYSNDLDRLYGTASMPQRTYSLSAEARPTQRIRVRESFESNTNHDAGTSTLNSLFVVNVPGTALSQQTAETTIQPDLLKLTDNRSTTELLVDVTKNIMVRVGYRYEWGQAIETSGLTSDTYPYETGNLKQHVLLAGTRLRPWKWLTLNGDLESSHDGQSYYRTGLANYIKVRGDARAMLRSNLFFNAGVHYMNNTNPADGVDAKFRSVQHVASLQWLPTSKTLTLIAEYTHAEIDANVNYLTIFPFQTSDSQYLDYSHTGSLFAELALPGTKAGKAKVTVGGSFVTTSGSMPSRFYQPQAKLLVPICKKVSFYSEWKYYGLNEPFYAYQGFHTNTVMTGLRFVM